MCNTENEENQSFLSHLETLRQTLLRCVYSVAILLPFTFYFAPKVLNKLIDVILAGSDVALNYFSPTEVFLLQIKTALVIDIIIAFPYIVYQLWKFILPALYEHEKKVIKSQVLLSAGLFLSGVAFCLFVILPYIIKFGLSFSSGNIQAMLGISNVVNLALWLCVIFGLMFQVPIVTYALIKHEIVSYETIADKRPYVVVILLIIAGILTPPDILSQVLLALPTYLLFEAGLISSRFRKNIATEDEAPVMSETETEKQEPVLNQNEP